MDALPPGELTSERQQREARDAPTRSAARPRSARETPGSFTLAACSVARAPSLPVLPCQAALSGFGR
jgi:hypothetical protein